jgi:hypothetical protein
MLYVGLDIENAKASAPREGFIPSPKLKLLDQVSEVMRFKHYSIRTEQSYREWIRRFILFHGKRHPREMGAGGDQPISPRARFQRGPRSGLPALRPEAKVSLPQPGMGKAVCFSRGQCFAGPAPRGGAAPSRE